MLTVFSFSSAYFLSSLHGGADGVDEGFAGDLALWQCDIGVLTTIHRHYVKHYVMNMYLEVLEF